jgi:presenilin-like A22 family membrane protease
MLTLYVTFVILFTHIPFLSAAEYNIASFVAAVTLTVLLYKYPEWYIVDITRVLSAGGISRIIRNFFFYYTGDNCACASCGL